MRSSSPQAFNTCAGLELQSLAESHASQQYPPSYLIIRPPFDHLFRDAMVSTPHAGAAQLATNKLANVGFAIGTDIGDPLGPFGMVHPRNKKLVGQRLAAAALSIAYSTPTQYLPPTFKSSTATANGTILTVTVTLDNVPTKLVAAHDHCKTELKVQAVFCAWFSITCSDNAVLNATATIGADGRSVVLRATATAGTEGVTAVASSFGWNAWPINTIMTAEGLPLQPWKKKPLPVMACKRVAVQGCFNDTGWASRGAGILPLYQPQVHDKVTYEVCASACYSLKSSYLAGIDAGTPAISMRGAVNGTATGTVQCSAPLSRSLPQRLG